MEINFKKVSINNLNNQISFIFTKLLPVILILVFIYFVIGLRLNKNDEIENWVNYINIPYGEIQTGTNYPVSYYERKEYRKPYRWPLGIKQSYPVDHIAPIML